MIQKNANETEVERAVRLAYNNLRLLEAHVQKWGLVLGSMSLEMAYEYISETERLSRTVAQTIAQPENPLL